MTHVRLFIGVTALICSSGEIRGGELMEKQTCFFTVKLLNFFFLFIEIEIYLIFHLNVNKFKDTGCVMVAINSDNSGSKENFRK